MSRFLLLARLLLLPAYSVALAQVDQPEKLFHAAVAAQQSGDSATALKEYSTLLRAYPRNTAVRVNLGSLYVDLGRFGDAVDIYRAGLKFEPANGDLRFGMDAALAQKNDAAGLQAASVDLETLRIDNPDNLNATLLLADVYLRQRRSGQAVNLLLPLEDNQKENDEFELLLSRAMLQAGQMSQGASRMEQVAAKTGAADAYLAAGEARLTMSQFDLAQKDAEAAINKQADLPGVETLYGTVLARMGSYKASQKALRTALAQDPEDFDANYGLGSLLYFDRDLPEASKLLGQALRVRPSSSDARYKLALVQQSLGEVQAALRNLETVTRQRPDWPEAHARLSALYFQLHRPADGAREAKAVEDLATRQTANPATPQDQ